MTIMTPIEGITAPARATGKSDDAVPGTTSPPIPTETFQAYDETPLLSSRRADGWSAANQRLFLEAIAEGHGVEAACLRVGLSAASAYKFRRTAKGAAFALGWRAASLVARDAIAETLLVRALEGQVTTFTRANGDVVTTHRHDNRLAMSLLARLDRQVEAAPEPDIKAARLVAQEFDAFLDLVSKDEGPARAGLFLARRCGTLATGLGQGEDDTAPTHDLAPIYALAAADRLVRTGVATAQEVAVADLDPTDRANWTAGQWQRADAAGIVALSVPRENPPQNPLASQLSQHSPVYDPAEDAVWWDTQSAAYRTCFAPPDDFDGHECGTYGSQEYWRDLDDFERSVMDGFEDDDDCYGPAARDAFFGLPAGQDDGEPADEDAAAAAGPPPTDRPLASRPESATV